MPKKPKKLWTGKTPSEMRNLIDRMAKELNRSELCYLEDRGYLQQALKQKEAEHKSVVTEIEAVLKSAQTINDQLEQRCARLESMYEGLRDAFRLVINEGSGGIWIEGPRMTEPKTMVEKMMDSVKSQYDGDIKNPGVTVSHNLKPPYQGQMGIVK